MAQVDRNCLKKLKTFRKKFDLTDEKKRHQILHRFFFLIDHCEGQLPNLQDIFQPREIDWLVGSRDKEGQTLLHLAVTKGNKKMTEFLLRNGSDPNAPNKSRLMTPLHMICDSNNKESAVFLKIFFDINDELNQQVKVNTQDMFDRTALHLALKHMNTEVAKLLLRRGASPDLSMKDGPTPLHLICSKGNDDKWAFLLKTVFEINDANHHTLQIDIQNNLGQSPLHCAVAGHFKIAAELLLRRGANPNGTMKDGSTPLHMIFNKTTVNDDEKATFLKFFFDVNDELHQPINVDVLDKWGRSTLHYAVQRRLKKTTESLLRRGADQNLSGKDGYTPLHMICNCSDNHTETTTFLEFFFDLNDKIHQLVNVDALNESNESPLLLALKNKNLQVAEVLLRRGANPNFVDNIGSQPLHLVINIGNDFEVAKFLKIFFEINDDKNYQVQIDARDEKDQTPLCMALDLEFTKTAEVLLRNGANPNLANERGSTPLHIICAGDYFDILEKFLPIFFSISDDKNQMVQVNAQNKWGRTPLQLAVQNFSPDVVEVLLERGADFSGFVFPTGSHFVQCYLAIRNPYQFERVYRVLVVVERLEERGYQLNRSDVLTIMKTFTEWKSFDDSVDHSFWLNDEKLMNEAKKFMINPGLSLYDLIRMRPNKAEKLLTYVELTRSTKFKMLSYDSRTICRAQFYEILSKRFRRRWTMEFFLVLTRYQLPILCCEKIIDLLNNEDFLGICLAAEIVVEEET